MYQCTLIVAVRMGLSETPADMLCYSHSSGRNGKQKFTSLLFSKTMGRDLTQKSRRSLSTIEKKAYIDAVLCLQQHPAITKEQFKDNPWVHPINRYDDFQAVHHNQTLSIHFVVS